MRLIVRWAGPGPGSGYEVFNEGHWGPLPSDELTAAVEGRRVIYWNPAADPQAVV